jgi:hypothetical protein
MPKPRTISTRLRCARTLLREWQHVLFTSEERHDPGNEGKVSPAVKRELARFDDARKAISEALKLIPPF